MSIRAFLFLLAATFVVPSFAQTFDVEQFDQLFRPRVRLDLRHQPENAFRDTSDHFSTSEGAAVFTFPIRSRFDVGVKLDGNANSFGDLVNNSVRVRASEVLGTVRFGARQVELGFDSVPTRQLYSANMGLIGMKLTKMYRVLFWSANVYVSEEDATIDQAVPRFNGTIGQMHMKGLRRNFFYGLAIAVSDRLTLPVPFIGGIAPLGSKWSFQYVIPAQLAIGFSPRKHTKFMAGISTDAFRSGSEWQAERANLNYGAVRTFLSVRHKANGHLQLRADVSYAIAQTVRYSGNDNERVDFPLVPGVSFGVGVNILFGRGVMERIMEEVVR